MKAEPVDYLGQLSPEIMQKILLYLTPKDVNSVWNCNKKMRLLYNCDYFWKKQCKKNGYEELEESLKLPGYESYLQRFVSRWQGVSNYNRQLQHNWFTGVSKTTMTTEVMYHSFYYFDDDILVALLDHSEEELIRTYYAPTHQINMIDCSTGLVIGNLTSPTKFAKVMRCQDKLVVLGDGYIKVWDIPTKTLYKTMVIDYFCEFQSMMESCHANKNLVGLVQCYSGLAIFDYEKEEIAYSKPTAVIVSIGDEVIALGLKNGIIQIVGFDFRDLMTFNLAEDAVIKQIEILNDHLLVMSWSPVAFHASVWSLTEKMKLTDLFDIYRSEREFGSIQGSYFFFSSHFRSVYDTLNVWKYQHGISLVLAASYSNRMVACKSNNRYLFIYSLNDIEHWCLETGEKIKNINDVVINYTYETLALTETKYAYIDSNFDIVIQDYAMFIK